MVDSSAVESTFEFDAFAQHQTVGSELLRQSRFADARANVEAALALRPKDVKAMSLVGVACFQRTEQHENAHEMRAHWTDVETEAVHWRLGVTTLPVARGAVKRRSVPIEHVVQRWHSCRQMRLPRFEMCLLSEGHWG